MGVVGTVEKKAIMEAYKYVCKDPEKNLPNIFKTIEKYDMTGSVTKQAKTFEKVFTEKGNWYDLIMSFFTSVDDGIRDKILENIIINGTLIGSKKQKASREKYGCNVPWTILMDPTSACNLHCTGCWAAEYGHKLSLTYDEMNSIVKQGKELGVYVYMFSGGEPTVRKDDLIRLCDEHPDCEFQPFTNGTLIDDKFADEILRVKNFFPAISCEGTEESTDFRRGAGTFKKATDAMARLRERKIPFGISNCYTSKNYNVIGSEEYFDQMIEWGAKYAWFFTYIPVGKDAVPDLIATPEQRKFMYDQLRAFRKTKPLLTIDFWNDGEYINGCIAGGRYFLHINANGDFEPCGFIHYADHNLHKDTLLSALQGPMFMAYHKGQPFNDNMLRPCPLLDNPEALRKMVDETGAKSTDMQSPEDVHDLTAKTEKAAEEWAKVADPLWARDGGAKRKAKEEAAKAAESANKGKALFSKKH
ncbi:MAG: radical SAM protein [Lachnospiraceae bacterium]|jgi:MoaA/NifB/PqqE/SkfB family radical SAM enzyme|nr:radical SAM protein [Lachnospiraceae bacterium]MCI1726342.1 radical SAM protein [Lachnospiraceae bacterium]